MSLNWSAQEQDSAKDEVQRLRTELHSADYGGEASLDDTRHEEDDGQVH